MADVINFDRAKRRVRGLRPTLGLIGMSSTADVVMSAALDAVDESERARLFKTMAAGTYADMLASLLSFFEIEEFDKTRVAS